MSEQVPKIIAEIHEKLNLLGDIAIKAHEAVTKQSIQIKTLTKQVAAIPDAEAIKKQAKDEIIKKLMGE